MIKNLKEEVDQIHKPVLVKEVCEAFGLIAPLKYQADTTKKPIIIDATVGGGGHAWEFIKNGAYVIGIDADEKMIKIAGDNLQKLAYRARGLSGPEACPTGNCENFFKLVNENFTSIDLIAKSNGLDHIDAILFDLGISSHHLLFEKGFSFQNSNPPLDMRLSDTQKVTAADLLNALPKKSLIELFSVSMPYFKASKLAGAIIDFRKNKIFESVSDFLEIINKTFPVGITKGSKKYKSVSTLPFLALRIAVNTELDNLKIALAKSWNLLDSGGKLAVISFHSGEDRIIKDFFAKLHLTEAGEVNKKPIAPGKDEIDDNPRSRSAKLRIISKI